MGLIGNGLLGQMSQGGLSRRRSSAPIPPPFAPSDIPNLYVWLDGAVGTFSDDAGTAPSTESGVVALWEDQSGNGNDAFQTSNSKRPLLMGGQLVLDGSDDHIELADIFDGELTAGEFFIVFQIDTDPPGAAAQTGAWRFGGVGLSSHHPFTDGNIYDGWGSTDRQTVGNSAADLTLLHWYNVSTAAGAWTARINGTQEFTTSESGVAWSATPRVGESFSDSYHMAGAINEIIIYSRVLTSEERNDIGDYLTDKYSI